MSGRTAVPRLHVIVDSVVASEQALAALASRCDGSLGDGSLGDGSQRDGSHDTAALAVQVRLKAGTDRDRFETTRRVAARCAAANTWCVVNDRVDLALGAGATGVHLGADDLPVAAVRRFVPEDFVVGGTARDPHTARRLVDEGASYLGVGPTFATTSKAGLPDPLGLDGVRTVADAVDVPVIAIAGITAERIPDLLTAGASGVAVISAVANAPDPTAAVVDFLERFAPHGAEP